jgi:hypothetical protein
MPISNTAHIRGKAPYGLPSVSLESVRIPSRDHVASMGMRRLAVGRVLLFGGSSFSNIVIPLISSAVRVESSSVLMARLLYTPKFNGQGKWVVFMRPPLQLRGGSPIVDSQNRKGRSKFDYKASFSSAAPNGEESQQSVKDALYQLTTQIFSSKTGKLPDYYEVFCV